MGDKTRCPPTPAVGTSPFKKHGRRDVATAKCERMNDVKLNFFFLVVLVWFVLGFFNIPKSIFGSIEVVEK